MVKIYKSEYPEIINKYQSGKSCDFIGKEYNVSGASICQILQKQNIPRRSCNCRSRSDFLNEQYFDTIDTEDKAYWLGFILGDGGVTKHQLYFCLSTVDIKHLQKFADCLNSSRKPYVAANGFAKIEFNSKHMINSLDKLGIIPRKTYNCFNLPKISDSLMPHFMRGYLDADGWFCKVSRKTYYELEIGIVAHNKELIEQTRNWFNSIGINRNSVHAKTKENSVTWQYCIRGMKNFKTIISTIYNKPSTYLDRKYEKIKGFIEEFNLNLEI